MFPSFLHGIIKQLILCLMIVSYSELSKRKPIRPTVCTHGDKDNATICVIHRAIAHGV